MTRFFDYIWQLPAIPKACVNTTAIGAAVATYFDKIQGPMAGLAATLSVVWLALQIFGWVRNEIRNVKR